MGDVLDVDGNRGQVTSIGIRSSVLQLWDSTEVLIPNSELLEQKVTNWTFSNRLVRFTISVGVAYGTDTRKVIATLIEGAERHGLVAKDPKPQAFLIRFDDSALAFELRFWVDILTTNAAQISSDLRQMITGAFAENGIVIAFPQRDLHFQAAPFPLMAESERP
jgi:small-conductance mechanosensitive channel